MQLFIFDWRMVLDRRMPRMRVVPILDELKHGYACLGLSLERATVQQLTLEPREETLGHGIVKAVLVPPPQEWGSLTRPG